MGLMDFIAKTRRWSFFLLAIACLMGSFVHFNIQFSSSSCDDASATALLQEQAKDTTLSVKCLGRNLVYLQSQPLATDSNKKFWRTVFTLNPDSFVRIWSPFFLSLLALVQNFLGFKWDVISGNVLKSFLYSMFWMVFAVIGYAANWGVVVGIGGALWIGLLDVLLIFTKRGDEVPVLQFDLGNLSKMRGRSGSAYGDNQGQAPVQVPEEEQEQQQQQSDAPILDTNEQNVNNMSHMNDMNETIDTR